MEQNDDNTIQYPVGHHYGDIKRSNQAAIHENDVTSSKIVIGESLNGSQPSSPQRDIAFEVDGDAGSVGGMSAEFGSSSRLIVPSNGFNDADSGIHSAQGPTPLIPDPSDPSYVHSDLEPSALKATTRHSFSNVHHEHVVPPQDGNQPKEKVIEVSKASMSPAYRPLSRDSHLEFLPLISMLPNRGWKNKIVWFLFAK